MDGGRVRGAVRALPRRLDEQLPRARHGADRGQPPVRGHCARRSSPTSIACSRGASTGRGGRWSRGRTPFRRIEALRARGQKVGLITVCSQEVADIWDETPFAGLFDATVFSSSVGLSKPDLEIYELACEQLDVDPADCLFVGDGANDELPGAERAGMTAVQLQGAGRTAHARRRSVAGRVDRAPGRGRRSDQVTDCYKSEG